MDLINSLLSNEMIKILALTIIHSIWQGLLIAIVCWFILLFVRRGNAQTRYMVNISGVASILILAVITFLTLYKPVIDESGIVTDNIIESVNSQKSIINNTGISNYKILSLTNGLLPYITILWMFGALIFFIKFAGGMFYNRQLKTVGLTSVGGIWNERLKKLSKKIKTPIIVRLYESALVNVPTVIGHIRPVILFPIGAISGIPIKQVEAIIAHELAHIKRYDYLINLIQSIMEILFFYHPAVWWLNSKVNTERENCCDDMAMKITGDRLIYARALSNIEEVSQDNLRLSPAFSGGKDKLLNRIQRLYDRSYEKVGSGRFSTLAGIMLLVVFVILFSSGVQSSIGQEQITPKVAVNNSIFSGNESITVDHSIDLLSLNYSNNNANPVVFVQDTIIQSKRKIHLKDVEVDGKKYEVYLVLDEKNNVLELKIDGEKIDKENFGKYDKIVKTTIEVADIKLKEMEKKMEELQEKMEELHKDFSKKQEKLEFEMQEKFKEIEEIEFNDERLNKVFEEMEEHQEMLHERLKHLNENELRHVDEDIFRILEELDLRKEFESGRDYARRFYDKFDIEKYLDEDELRKFNKEILEEFKDWDMNKFKFDEQEMKKLQNNFRRNMKDFEFDREEMNKKLRKTEESFTKNAEKYEKMLQKSMVEQNELRRSRENEFRVQRENMEMRRNREARAIEERLIRSARERERDMAEREMLMQEEIEARNMEMQRRFMREEMKFERVVKVIENELFEDNIIDDELRTFELTQKRLRVNGKKQSKKMYEKYRDLYEDLFGKKLKKDFKIILDE